MIRLLARYAGTRPERIQRALSIFRDDDDGLACAIMLGLALVSSALTIVMLGLQAP
ncbi:MULTISPECIES: hypothetical protein [unclassified Sphingobium]|uniref:hypothetical protein n=1 Tax=unclassified Sphingobium TaxID=2611147 RepID=UPI0022241D43|nr:MULTISPECIES: hypothetical protein [unclassified Sphingobium]MCW2395861.1 hypothetical protein [Sphingobium sp. B8D3B]MCW2419377.1 hypothetical protein [Sphingobium sp. B8D3C]